MSLSLFAMGEFPAAAAQAHFALSLAPPTDWASIYGYYGDVSPYTKQLRALEKYSDDNPTAADGHFLLAYHYLMTGYTKPAVKELREVVKLAPQDKLAAALLKKFGGEGPALTPPAPPAPGSETKAEAKADVQSDPKPEAKAGE
jgi:tetratricopeptide (TPR) repeat protein